MPTTRSKRKAQAPDQENTKRKANVADSEPKCPRTVKKAKIGSEDHVESIHPDSSVREVMMACQQILLEDGDQQLKELIDGIDSKLHELDRKFKEEWGSPENSENQKRKIVLEFTDGRYNGKTWKRTLSNKAPDFAIGRSRAKKFTKRGISLSKCGDVSTHHATISMNEFGELFVEDNFSMNGTTVDGVTIDCKRRLAVGTEITFA